MKKAYRTLTYILIVICSILIGIGGATGLPGISLLGFLGFLTIVLLYLYSRRYLLAQDVAIYICFFILSLFSIVILFAAVFPSLSLAGNTVGTLLLMAILPCILASLLTCWCRAEGRLYRTISPIDDYKEPHSLDDSYTDMDAYRGSDFENDHVSVRTQDHKYPTQRGEWVRSKQEAIIANVLFRLGIKYDYERPLRYPGIYEMVCPDFTIYWNRTVYYWEHLGMLDNEEYRRKWELTKNWYHEAGYADNLIVSTSKDLDVIEQFVKDKFPSKG